MSTYEVEVRFSVEPLADLEDLTDQLMEAILDEPNTIDPDVGMNLKTGQVDVTMVVDAADQGAAMSTGFNALRSALHKIGGHTHGWEAKLREALATVKPPATAA